MKIIIFVLVLSALCSEVAFAESEDESRPNTLVTLEDNFMRNEKHVVEWLKAIGEKENKENLIERLIESDTPEFVCSLAYCFDHIFDNAEEGEEISNNNYVESKVLALTFYQWAAEKGYAPAMTRASVLFDEAGDHANAIEWENKGVEAGDSLAILNHGLRLLIGKEFDDTTEQNLVEGWKWVFVASELGEKKADTCIKTCGGPMNAMIQGKIKAKEWKLKHPQFFK